MAKSLLYQLFKTGSIPAEMREKLEAETLVAADEGLRGTWFSKNFKSPTRRSLYSSRVFVGFLAISRKHILAYAFGRPQISLPMDDPRVENLHSELMGDDKIVISFESAHFHSDWQGVIELRYQTEKAKTFHDALLHLGVKQGRAE
jgi:hypothetical protein